MKSGLILLVALGLYWLSLSGYFKPILLTFGVLSVMGVVVMSGRMNLLDEETAPYLHIPKTLSYFVWLGKEVLKANIAVVRTVMKPDMEISPTLVKVPMRESSDMGRSMFANSITLTPGTVSVDLEDGHILVHALTKDMADPDDFTEMGERAGWSVGDAMAGEAMSGRQTT